MSSAYDVQPDGSTKALVARDTLTVEPIGWVTSYKPESASQLRFLGPLALRVEYRV